MPRIFSIETSCDETSLALVKSVRGVFSIEKEITSSQIEIHKKYGGVVPEVAARNHAETIFPILRKMFKAGKRPSFDAIAVTAGPGLITSLRVGVDVARTLAWLWKKPLIKINHIEGHIYANWLPQKKTKQNKISFPAVALIVSGGHTELLLMKDHGKYELLGATRDDAAGEVFDKVSNMLGLGYPGGPAVSKKAEHGNAAAFGFPRPMLHSKNFDFSFSGLKTAVRYEVLGGGGKKKMKKIPVSDICASFEEAVADVLIAKTIRAVQHTKAKTVLLGGGVAANRRLRIGLAKGISKFLPGVKYVEPDLMWTTDNAAMIGAAAFFHLKKKQFIKPEKLLADPNWELGRS